MRTSESDGPANGVDCQRRVPDSELSEPAHWDARDAGSRPQSSPKKRSKSNRKPVKKSGKASVLKAVSVDEFNAMIQRRDRGRGSGSDDCSGDGAETTEGAKEAESREDKAETMEAKAELKERYDSRPSVVTWQARKCEVTREAPTAAAAPPCEDGVDEAMPEGFDRIQRRDCTCPDAENMDTPVGCTPMESGAINDRLTHPGPELGTGSGEVQADYNPLSQSEYLALPSVITWMLPTTEAKMSSPFESISGKCREWTQEQIEQAIQKVQLWKTLLQHHNVSELRNKVSLRKTLNRTYGKLDISGIRAAQRGASGRCSPTAAMPSMVTWMPIGSKAANLTAAAARAPARHALFRNSSMLQDIFGLVGSWQKRLNGLDMFANRNETMASPLAWLGFVLPENLTGACLPHLIVPRQMPALFGRAGSGPCVAVVSGAAVPSTVGWMPVPTRRAARGAFRMSSSWVSLRLPRFGAEEVRDRLEECARVFASLECVPFALPKPANTQARPWRSLPSVVTWAPVAEGRRQQHRAGKLLHVFAAHAADGVSRKKKLRHRNAPADLKRTHVVNEKEASASWLAHGGEGKKEKKTRAPLKPSMVTWMPSRAHRGQLLVVLGLISRELNSRRRAAKRWLRELSMPDLTVGTSRAVDGVWTALPSAVTWASGVRCRMPHGAGVDAVEHVTADCRVFRAEEKRSAQLGSGRAMKPSMVSWMPSTSRASRASILLAHAAEVLLRYWRPLARDALLVYESVLKGTGLSSDAPGCRVLGIPLVQDGMEKEVAEALEVAVAEELLEGSPPVEAVDDKGLTGVGLPHVPVSAAAAAGSEPPRDLDVGRFIAIKDDGNDEADGDRQLSLPADNEEDARDKGVVVAAECVADSGKTSDGSSAADVMRVSADFSKRVDDEGGMKTAQEPQVALPGTTAAVARIAPDSELSEPAHWDARDAGSRPQSSPKKRSKSNRKPVKKSGKASVLKAVSVDEFNAMIQRRDRGRGSGSDDCSGDGAETTEGAKEAESREDKAETMEAKAELKERYDSRPSVVTWQARKCEVTREAPTAAPAPPCKDGVDEAMPEAASSDKYAQQGGSAPATPPLPRACDDTRSAPGIFSSGAAMAHVSACLPVQDLLYFAPRSTNMTSARDRAAALSAAAREAVSRLTVECSARISALSELAALQHQEYAARWLAASSSCLKPLPCLHALATEEQRGAWVREELEYAQQVRQTELELRHRNAREVRDRLQRIRATKEDAWRRSSAQVQHDAWLRCWQRRQARALALAANRKAAREREVERQLEVQLQDAERALVPALQEKARTSACLAAHGAAAIIRQHRRVEEICRREAGMLELSRAQSLACEMVRKAHEEEAACAALVAEHKLSSVERGRAKSLQTAAQEADRKGVAEKQQASLAEVRAREEERQLLEARLVLHAERRLERQRLHCREAAAVEEARGAVSQEQHRCLDEAQRRKARAAREKEMQAQHRVSAAARDSEQVWLGPLLPAVLLHWLHARC